MNDPSTGSGQDNKPIAIIAVTLVAILGGLAWWFSRSTVAPANASPKAVIATEAPIDSKAAEKPVDLPPMERLDFFRRPMLQARSNRPELANWLSTDALIHQLAMAIDQASTGSSPARDFKAVKPSGAFAVRGAGTTRV